MVAALSLCLGAGTAVAGGPLDWCNNFNRYFGYGISDGYHARTGCPPKQSHVCRPPVSSYPATWSHPQPAPRALPPR